jgi:biopolymer transport protein ExbD
MKLLTPLPHKKARIEIIPLIDIMFFLLAVMMLVSLNMVQMKGLKLNLPTAVSATSENRSDFLTLSVKADGSIYIDKSSIQRPALVDELKKRKASQPDLRVYIQGDSDAIHGDIIAVLDRVRSAGIQKVAFQIKPDSRTGGIIDHGARSQAASPEPPSTTPSAEPSAPAASTPSTTPATP